MTSTQKILLAGGIGVIAYVLWKKSQAAAAPPAAPPAITPPGGTPIDPVTEYPPVIAPVPPPVFSTPTPPPPVSGRPGSTTGSSSGFVPPNGIDPNVYGVVMGWIQADGDSRFVAMGNNADPVEFNGMYNIIQNNLWGNPSVTDFWNNIYAKYHGQ